MACLLDDIARYSCTPNRAFKYQIYVREKATIL